MKRFFCILLSTAFLFAGCSQPSQENSQPTQAPTTTTATETVSTTYIPQQEAMYAVSVPTETKNEYADDGTLLYSHTYQSMQLTLPDPDVANKVIIDFLSRIDATHTEAEKTLSAAKAAYKGSPNWTPYLYNITYNPTRIDQNVLSLFGNRVVYSGGSHPERLCASASYDLVTGDVLTLGSIMSAQASTEDFCQLVLQALSLIEEDKYLYDGYESIVKNRFSNDESQDEDWYFTATGLCFYFVPYQIAPYSSGVITVELPYDTLAGLLYDGYFPGERETTSGNIQTSETGEFTQIAELVVDTDGKMVFLYTDGVVWDVQIEYGAWDTENTFFTPVCTALYSSSLTPGDAIMIQANELKSLRLSYFDGTETVQLHLSETEQGVILEH